MLTDRLARTLEVVTVVDGVLFILELLKVIACIVILSNAEDPSETSSLPMEQPAVVHVFSKSLGVIIAQALFTALVFLFQQENILLSQIKLSLSHSLTRKCIRNWHNFVFTALEAGALLIVWTNETAYDSTLFNLWIALLFFFRFIELWLGTILAGAGAGGWCRAVRFDAIFWVYVRLVFFLLVGCQSVACEVRGRLFGSILSSSFAQYMALYKEIPAVVVSEDGATSSPTDAETAAPPSPPAPPSPSPAPPCTRSCTWDIVYTVFLFKICIAIAVVSVILSNVAVASTDDTSGPYSIDTCDRDCRLRDFHFTLKLCAAALSLYGLQMALTAWCNRYHPTIRPYDAFVDMVIGFDLNAAVLTFLLDPFLCLVSSLDCAADILVFVAYEHSHVTPKYGRLLAMFFVLLLTCTPVLLVGQRLWRKSAHRPAPWRFSAVVMALTCADVIVLFLLTRATQVAVMPVSLLSFLSRLRTRYFPAKHQQALGTERPSEMVSSSPSPSKGDPLLLSLAFRRAKWIDDPPSTPRWVTWRRALVKLCSRYTVVYSLLKMLTCIAYSLIANQGYRSCGLDAWGTYGDPLTCHEPLACRAFCPGWSYLSEGAQHGYSHPPQFTYDDLAGTCTVEVAGNCSCTNWWIFQFLVILGHLVHFGIQCWFYVHYDHFDPQQHQILCVEQYALVGDNVTWLFTYPAMGWLAVVEFGILVLVWVEVFTHNGSYCVHPGSYELNASNSALVWAVLNTFVEIYKANVSIATRAREQGQWVRMGAALVRVDLFVFYASTLVFQTLLFPISVFAAVFTALTQDPEEEKAEDAAGGGDVPRPVDAVDRGSAPHDSESLVRPSAAGTSSLSLSAALNPLQHPSAVSSSASSVAVVELRHSSSHSDPRSTTTTAVTAGAHDDV